MKVVRPCPFPMHFPCYHTKRQILQPKFHAAYLVYYITYYFSNCVKVVFVCVQKLYLHVIYNCTLISLFYLIRFLYLNFTDIINLLTMLSLKKVWKFYFSGFDIFSCFSELIFDSRFFVSFQLTNNYNHLSLNNYYVLVFEEHNYDSCLKIYIYSSVS